MAEVKTVRTGETPSDVIDRARSARKRMDGQTLLHLFERVTGESAEVWAGKMIGFGSYRYTYPSGHSGEAFKTGFAVTDRQITLYIYLDGEMDAGFLDRLGKVRVGKSCVYINKLADIDTGVLEQMIREMISYADKLDIGK